MDHVAEAAAIYGQLQTACKTLESWNDHAIAAVVSHAMAMVQEKYGVGGDHFGWTGHLH